MSEASIGGVCRLGCCSRQKFSNSEMSILRIEVLAFCGLDFIADYSYEIFNNDLLHGHTICCMLIF